AAMKGIPVAVARGGFGWGVGFGGRVWLPGNGMAGGVEFREPPHAVGEGADGGFAAVADEGLVIDVSGLRIAVFEPGAGGAEDDGFFVGVVGHETGGLQ